LAQLGYGFSYRVLDAQYFGVAQRRRRVFVVGYLGDWRPAAAVLFESQSLRGGSPPSRETREEAAGRFVPGVANCLTRRMHKGINSTVDEGQTPIVQPIAFGAQNSSSQGDSVSTEVTPTLDKSKTPAVAVDVYNQTIDGQTAATLTMACGGTNTSGPKVMQAMAVRRLTPTECERLQGFSDGYTDVRSPTPDGPRYKALGNSMAVPVMRWIGGRINKYEQESDLTGL